MTRTASARVAGVTFLVYIAAGIGGMLRVQGAIVSVVLSLVMCFSALVLAVTLYAITRDVDRDVALLAMACRIGEGILGAIFLPLRAALQTVAPAGVPSPEAANTIRAFVLLARSYNEMVGATFFAVGSTLFCWLLLRGRIVPSVLAWLGVVASVLLVVALPLQLARELPAFVAQVMWLPMLAFEVPVAIWLVVKGADVSHSPESHPHA